MGGVVEAMPGVHGDYLLQRLAAEDRVRVAASEGFAWKRRKQNREPGVERGQQVERDGDRELRVGQFCPFCFFVGFDGGPVFG